MAESLAPLVGPDDPRFADLSLPVERDPDALRAVAGDESVVRPVVPGAAVFPRTVGEISAALRWAHDHRIPVTARGAGSGKAGGCVPSAGGLVLGLGRMDAILSVRPEDGFAEVEPGVITGAFRDAMAHEHGLFYPPDPASLSWCTLGGNVATNAGGPVALQYGVTERFVLGLTVVLADGRVIETGRRQPKDVAGYDLTSLLVGSEGTLGVIAGVRLGLLPQPREVKAAVLGFDTLAAATAALVESRAIGILPRAMELVDPVTLRRVRARWDGPDLPFGIGEASAALLLVEVDGVEGSTERTLQALLEAVEPRAAVVPETAAEREALWATRREMSRRVKEGAVGWVTEDIAVPLGAMARVVGRLETIGERHGLVIAAYGHAGDGNLHVNVLWEDPAGEDRAGPALDAVMRLAMSAGGTITGEHGVGRAKRPWIASQLGAPVLDLQRAIKAAWDPAGILNPGVKF